MPKNKGKGGKNRDAPAEADPSVSFVQFKARTDEMGIAYCYDHHGRGACTNGDECRFVHEGEAGQMPPGY